MLLRVTVDPAEGGPALALEPGQPDPFPADVAPIRLGHSGNSNLRSSRKIIGLGDLRQSQQRRGRERAKVNHRRRGRRRRRRRRSRRRGGGERGFDGGFDRGLLLLLETKVSVAFGAEIHRGRAAEESAIVSAETVAFWCLASVLFRHVCSASRSIKTRTRNSSEY